MYPRFNTLFRESTCNFRTCCAIISTDTITKGCAEKENGTVNKKRYPTVPKDVPMVDMAQSKRDKKKDYLFQAILTLQTLDDCYTFFEDLCTIKEIEEMAKRMCGAKMLSDNKIYTEITETTGLSTATISRINRSLRYGTDGYNTVLERLGDLPSPYDNDTPDEAEKEDM